MAMFVDGEVRKGVRMQREVKLLTYPYRMFLAKAMENHGTEGLLERLGEALSIIDTSAAFTDEERKEAKKLIYLDASEMISKFNRRC